MDCKISFIGAGKMASAMASAMAKIFSVRHITAYDVSTTAAEKFSERTGIKTAASLDDALTFADILILAVKPQNFPALFASIRNSASDKLIISIMAGIKIASIQEKSASQRIIRVMPNIPALLGKGISAYSASPKVSESDISIAEKILRCVGSSIRVQEDLMDIVTALSGSGPAYVFEFIEAMARAGEKAGLPYETALRLSMETVEGAAVLLRKSSLSPDQLRDNVTSPGGTTAKALESLSKNNFRTIISSALIAAKERAAELGKQYES